LARSLHDRGAKFEKRQFRLFTFSRLSGRFKLQDRFISFKGPIFLWVASPMVQILESFASHIIKKGKVKLGNSYLQPTSVEVSLDEQFTGQILVRTLSPITAYSTLQTSDGRRKTYYYSPFEQDFCRLIQENLFKKWTALQNGLYGAGLSGSADKNLAEGKNSLSEENQSDRKSVLSFKIWREKVSNRNHHILSFKDTIIKAWSGLYRLEGSEELMRVAFDCGLGAKNSQGFGMIEKYELK
jgi:CRISPR-associated endoribonuclease Cas6